MFYWTIKASLKRDLQILIKSSLYSLNTHSGVTSERYPSLRLTPGSTLQVYSDGELFWQQIGDLIGSGFELHTSCSRSKRLTTFDVYLVGTRNLQTFE